MSCWWWWWWATSKQTGDVDRGVSQRPWIAMQIKENRQNDSWQCINIPWVKGKSYSLRSLGSFRIPLRHYRESWLNPERLFLNSPPTGRKGTDIFILSPRKRREISGSRVSQQQHYWYLELDTLNPGPWKDGYVGKAEGRMKSPASEGPWRWI